MARKRKEVDKADLADHLVKVRVTTMIDMDVLKKLKEIAPKGYQTLLNQKLREAVLGEKSDVNERLAQLERAIQKLKRAG